MRICIIFCLLLSFSTTAQTMEEVRAALQKITNQEQANEFVATYSGTTTELFELNSRVDTTELDSKLIKLGVGNVMEFGSADRQKNFFFKVLKTESVNAFRVQYIFLDGNKLSSYEVDSVRSAILRHVRKGEAFDKLAKLYSMDGNGANGGDLGWFEEGMMVKEFEDEVKKRKKGEIFTIDVASEKWYYVVRKSHDDREDTKALVFYVEMAREN